MKHSRIAALVGTAAVLFLFLPLQTPAAEAQVNPVPKLPAKPYPTTPRLADGPRTRLRLLSGLPRGPFR